MALCSWNNSTIFTTPYSIYEGQSIFALDANNLFVVFADSASYNVYFSKSTDRGATWTTPANIDSNGGMIESDRAIWASSDGQTIYVTYISYGTYRPAFTKSVNGGASFGTSVDIDSTLYDASNPTIGVYGNDGQYIYIAYHGRFIDDSAYTRISFSNNFGDSWSNKTVRTSYACPTGVFGITMKVLSASVIYIVSGTKPVSWEMTFSKTSDSGDNWAHTKIDDTGGTYSVGYDQSIFVKDSNTIYLSYIKVTAGDDAPEKLYLAKSINGGTSFSLSTIDGSIAYGEDFEWPSIGSPDSGNTIIVSYNHYIQNDLKVAYSVDGGITWIKEIADGAACGYKTSLYCAGGCIFIVHSTWSSPWSMKLTKCCLSPYPPADPIDDNPDTLPDPGGDPQEITFRWETYKAIRSDESLLK